MNIRHLRRVPPVYQTNQAILTTFFTASVLAFLIIYLEVSRLLTPDRVLTLRDLRHLTKGFANDIPPPHAPLTPHLPYRRRKPSAIVIGFDHCGADHLLDLMARHSHVFVNRQDLRFFERNLTAQWYISQMPLTLPDHVTVDVSMKYITNPNALQSMAAFDRNIKIIIVICNPVLRLFLRLLSDSDHGKKAHKPHVKVTSTNFSWNSLEMSTDNGSFSKNLQTLSHTIDTKPRIHSQNLDKRAVDTNVTKTKRDIHKHSDSTTVYQTEHSANTDIKKNIQKIISNFKPEMVRHKEGNRTLNIEYFKNANFVSHISKVFTLFPQKRIHIVEMDRLFFNTTEECSRIFNFLHTNLKNIPSRKYVSKKKRYTRVMEENATINPYTVIYDKLRHQERKLFLQMNEFYSPLNSKLFSFLNETFSWGD